MAQRKHLCFLKWKKQGITAKCHTKGKLKCSREMLWQKQFEEQRAYFQYELLDMIYCNGVLTVAVYFGTWTPTEADPWNILRKFIKFSPQRKSREQGTDAASIQSTSSLLQSRIFCLLNGVTHSRQALPPQWNFNQDNPSEVWPEAHLTFDFRFLLVGN